jgi:hypothetical protein
MSGAEVLFYTRGELSVEEIHGEITRFWQDLDNGDNFLEAELSAAGIDRAALASIDRKNAVGVDAGTSGADPVVVTLLVTLAPSANRIIKDLWAIVLVRIRRRWGDDAIGEERSEH